jgi:hypothetical protein
MSEGIVIIACGESFKELVTRTVAVSRQYTALPIHIISNVSAEKWAISTPDVTVRYIECDTVMNRVLKLKLPTLSPFDQRKLKGGRDAV